MSKLFAYPKDADIREEVVRREATRLAADGAAAERGQRAAYDAVNAERNKPKDDLQAELVDLEGRIEALDRHKADILSRLERYDAPLQPVPFPEHLVFKGVSNDAVALSKTSIYRAVSLVHDQIASDAEIAKKRLEKVLRASRI